MFNIFCTKLINTFTIFFIKLNMDTYICLIFSTSCCLLNRQLIKNQCNQLYCVVGVGGMLTKFGLWWLAPPHNRFSRFLVVDHGGHLYGICTAFSLFFICTATKGMILSVTLGFVCVFACLIVWPTFSIRLASSMPTIERPALWWRQFRCTL